VKLNYPSYVRKVRRKLAPLFYRSVCFFADVFGFWRYPADKDTELFTKRILDRVYRHYKITRPIIKAEKGSGLESYFRGKRQQTYQPLLPEDFRNEACTTLSAVGDLMPVNGTENSVGKFYAKIGGLVFNTDISIANLELALSDGECVNEGVYDKVATLEQFNALTSHNGKRYTVFCTANNHIFDCGMEGFNTTHDHLKVQRFHFTGTNPTPDTRGKCLILSSNGVKFGLPAVTLRVNKSLPKGKDYLVNIILFHRFQGKVDLSLLEEQIYYCQSKACDFIIVSLHWGMEFEFFPRQDQVDIAHHLIEYGADAIISHHAHNIQPYEIYQTHRDPYRKAPIFYGLGNLSSKWPKPQFSLSLIVNFSVAKGQVNNTPKTLVSSVNVTPVLQMDYVNEKERYLQIEELKDLIKTDKGETSSQFIKEAGQYADLIIGRNWRS